MMDARVVLIVLVVTALFGVSGYFGWLWWNKRDEPTAAETETAAAAGDDEHVRYWVDQVTAKAKLDGELEMPSPQEVALRMQLAECDDSAPCGERVLEVMGRIAEKVAENKEMKDVRNALDYWTLRVAMGYPVPTAETILAKGVGSHPCTGQSPACETQMNEIVNGLRQTRFVAGAMHVAKFNEDEMQLRKQFVDDWKAGVASKKVPEGEDARKSAYMLLCKQKRLRGVNCDANYEALQNSIRKELGLPVVGILPGSTRTAGVPEQGANLDDPKLLETTFYPSDAAKAFEDPGVMTNSNDMPTVDVMSSDQKAVTNVSWEKFLKAGSQAPSTSDRFLSLLPS